MIALLFATVGGFGLPDSLPDSSFAGLVKSWGPLVIALLSSLYYLIWFLKKVVEHGGTLLKWMWKVVTSHRQAARESRAFIHSRISTSLLHTWVQLLTLLRFALVMAILWRWTRLRGIQWSADLGREFEPWLSVALGVAIGSYAFVTHWTRKKAEQTAADLEAQRGDAPISDRHVAWSPRLPDVFFWPALADVFLIFVVALCLPATSSEVHLGFFIPMATAWLFRAEGRALVLYLAICLCLFFDWGWTGWLIMKDQGDYGWLHVFLSSTFPRICFWAFICGLVIVMRVIRRNTEEQTAFFRTLAEWMPFEVFVKDDERRFVYANNRLLTKLSANKAKPLALDEVVGKRDEDGLVSDESKIAHYRTVDMEILSAQRDHYYEFEPNYANGSTEKIETIKVPILNNKKKRAFILGLCRDPQTDTDLWFFLNVVSKRKSHCFFRKIVKDDRLVFQWVNRQFVLDAGRTAEKDVIGKTDRELYGDDYAEIYESDDKKVMAEGEPIEKQEWHRPTGRTRRRVHVYKVQGTSLDGTINGVRGYFCDIHDQYVVQLGIEQLLSLYMQRLDKLPECANKSVALRLFSRMLQVLNLGDHELRQLKNRDVLDAPMSYRQLIWRPEEVDPFVSVAPVLSIMKALHKDVSFEDVPQWIEERKPRLDPVWFEACAAGLWAYAAARVSYLATINPDKPNLRITTRMGFDRGRFYFAVTDHAVDRFTDKIVKEIKGEKPEPTQEQQKVIAEKLSEFVEDIDDCIPTGLQVVQRVARICGGEVHWDTNADGSPGATFKFLCP